MKEDASDLALQSSSSLLTACFSLKTLKSKIRNSDIVILFVGLCLIGSSRYLFESIFLAENLGSSAEGTTVGRSPLRTSPIPLFTRSCERWRKNRLLSYTPLNILIGTKKAFQS